ncbi:hypothetical protein [Peribacillus tepidiphilus]|uniref:hypothetical protein n=1 Tax=Peribacillus tepidiphilus TaxID=2652445 RepID=UPI0012917444|nr:hypothetical protein [Peribacillus tepidiphilus]
MEKNIWKELLESMPDDHFIKLIQMCDISIPGFRQIKKDKIKPIKARFIMEALKNQNLLKVKKAFEGLHHYYREEEEKDIRSMDLERLLQLYDEGQNKEEILGILYSSDEEEHLQLAKEFFNAVSNQQTEMDILEKDAQEDQDTLIKELRSIIKSQEKKIHQLEQKNQDYADRYSQIEKEYNHAKKHWKEEKKTINKTIASLKHEKNTIYNQLEKLQREIDQFNEKLMNKDNELSRKNAEISHLHAQLLNVEKGTTLNKEIAAASEKKKIAVIGNPRNKKILQNNTFDLVVFETAELDEAIEREEAFHQYDEIWVLTYKVPPTKQKVLQEKAKTGIKEIGNFLNLTKILQRG